VAVLPSGMRNPRSTAVRHPWSVGRTRAAEGSRGGGGRSPLRGIRSVGSISICALMLTLSLGNGVGRVAAPVPQETHATIDASRTLGHPSAASTGGGTVVIHTDDSHAYNNTAIQSSFVLPSSSSIGTGIIDVWLLEPITETREVGVGVEFDSTTGPARAVAEWGEWYANGSRSVDVNRSLSLPFGVSAVLSIAWAGGVRWSLTANGHAIPSAPGGVVDLGASAAEGLTTASPSGLPSSAPSIWVNSSGPGALPQFFWPQAFGIGPSTSLVLPGDGIVQSSGNAWGVQGENQRAGSGPDAILESTSLPKVPNGTYAWGIGNVNFPPLAAWTSEDPLAFSTAGSALNITVPGGVGSSGSPIGICQELLEPLVNGPWITVGACWVGGLGVRAYMAVTQANGGAYQKEMFAPLPRAGTQAQFVVRDLGRGVWSASINGNTLTDRWGNRTIDAGSDLSNASLGPYGALRGDASADRPGVLTVPRAVLVFPSISSNAPILPPGGRIAPSDGRPPALVVGHLQNSSLPPGAIQVFPGRVPLPFETALWNDAHLPYLQVTSPAKLRAANGWEPQGFSIAVRTSGGEPVPDAHLGFSGPRSAGSLQPSAPTTGSDGTVWVVWYPPSAPGTWEVTITAAQDNFTPTVASVTLVLESSAPAAWAEVLLPAAALGIAALGVLLAGRRRE
jgi:hypothetical protein